MSVLSYIILFSLISSLPSILAAFAFKKINQEKFKKFGYIFLSFAAGTLLGVIFFDIIPELFSASNLEKININLGLIFVVFGFILSFLMEKLFGFHHHHKIKCENCLLPRAKISIFSDGIHNFTDGIAIAVAFLIDIKLGVLVSISVILHEVPQEISDFIILLSSKITWLKALFLNFITALTSLVGALLGYFILKDYEFLSMYLLAISAGGFLYLSTSDIIPEIKELKQRKNIVISFILIIIGLGLIYILGLILNE